MTDDTKERTEAQALQQAEGERFDWLPKGLDAPSEHSWQQLLTMRDAADALAATSAPAGATPEDLGQLVDQLRVPYEAAKSRLHTFGQIQIRRDPSGYAKAKQELKRAKESHERALDAYQRALGPAAARPVTGRTLY